MNRVWGNGTRRVSFEPTNVTRGHRRPPISFVPVSPSGEHRSHDLYVAAYYILMMGDP